MPYRFLSWVCCRSLYFMGVEWSSYVKLTLIQAGSFALNTRLKGVDRSSVIINSLHDRSSLFFFPFFRSSLSLSLSSPGRTFPFSTKLGRVGRQSVILISWVRRDVAKLLLVTRDKSGSIL